MTKKSKYAGISIFAWKITELTNSNVFFQSTNWLLTEAGKISIINK